MKTFARRDFLKLMASIPAGLVLSRLLSELENSTPTSPHIIVIVLDALTARNMSLYGYPRNTTPNIERFAARANVYHAHYSAGTYTTPGTASLLTGTYPWTHRAINIKGLVSRVRRDRNIFHLLGSHYHRIAFTQNRLANYLLSQFHEDIDQHLPRESFSKLELSAVDAEQVDHLAKSRAFDDFLLKLNEESGSLLIGTLNRIRKLSSFDSVYKYNFQYSMRELIFDIDDVFAGISSQVNGIEDPSFCYFHLFPPHAPYIPGKKFRSLFQDNWKPVTKQIHPLQSEYEVIDYKELNEERLKYDKFIATTDAAFGEFLDQLENTGLINNSYVTLTSDHGESFERGYLEHTGPFVYEPGIHIPLIVSTPGQTSRNDFYSTTNSVDLLPSLMHFAGLGIPEWSEGEILPGFGKGITGSRVTYSMDAKKGNAFGNLFPITIAMYQGDYKLIYYFGYSEEGSPYHQGLYELYNIKQDPEEMRDLINDEAMIANEMKERLLRDYEIANSS